jgi:Tol biopolymer transport system component
VFSGTNAVSQFTWFDRTGRTLGTVGAPADYNTFDLSADGTRVVASIDRAGGSDLWLLDTTRTGLASRFTSRPAPSVYPVWSPDGRHIVFGSDPLLNLFRRSVEGAEEQRVTRASITNLPLDWSPDGTTVMMYAVGGPTTGRDLMTVSPLGGETQPQPYVNTPFNEWWARFMPTIPTRRVAYQSDESGRWEIYVDSYPTPGRRRLISTGGGQYPVWAPGGRELFYLSPDYTLMSTRITVAGDDIDSSPPQPLFRLPAIDTGRSPYDVAPDGQRFLVRATPPQAARTLSAIVNWPALLR